MERASDSMSSSPIYEAKSGGVRLYLTFKRLLYSLCKWIGLFHLARRMTRGGLRILCYHGFSIDDESEFSPHTFMKPGTFEGRMLFLRARGFPVLGLADALEAQENGLLPPNAVVITIDDGFYSTYRYAWPVLKELSMPATVYVTTYYAVKGTPIFRLAVQYIFWKTRERMLDPSGLGLPGTEPIPIATPAEKSDALMAIIRYGETRCGEEGRKEIATLLGERLGVDYGRIVENRILSIMNGIEIAELARAGIDIELHSHRHDLPLDRAAAEREIEENRAVLEPLASGHLRHFCYPSGFYKPEQIPWLEANGIVSAVTCEPGYNDRLTPRLRLRRFIDGEDVSFIEYEAEIMGFSELMRRAEKAISGLIGRRR